MSTTETNMTPIQTQERLVAHYEAKMMAASCDEEFRFYLAKQAEAEEILRWWQAKAERLELDLVYAEGNERAEIIATLERITG